MAEENDAGKIANIITSKQRIFEMLPSAFNRVMYLFFLSFHLYQTIVPSCFSPHGVQEGVGVRLFTSSKHFQAKETLCHGYTL